jgi:hypothetical protein
LTRNVEQTNFLNRGISRYFGEHNMINSLRTWFGQVTTGHGTMILAGTLLSVLAGSTTWGVAAPFLVAGVIGVIWPESSTLQLAGQTVATDVMGMLTAYNNRAATPPAAAKPVV